MSRRIEGNPNPIDVIAKLWGLYKQRAAKQQSSSNLILFILMAIEAVSRDVETIASNHLSTSETIKKRVTNFFLNKISSYIKKLPKKIKNTKRLKAYTARSQQYVSSDVGVPLLDEVVKNSRSGGELPTGEEFWQVLEKSYPFILKKVAHGFLGELGRRQGAFSMVVDAVAADEHGTKTTGQPDDQTSKSIEELVNHLKDELKQDESKKKSTDEDLKTIRRKQGEIILLMLPRESTNFIKLTGNLNDTCSNYEEVLASFLAEVEIKIESSESKPVSTQTTRANQKAQIPQTLTVLTERALCNLSKRTLVEDCMGSADAKLFEQEHKKIREKLLGHLKRKLPQEKVDEEQVDEEQKEMIDDDFLSKLDVNTINQIEPDDSTRKVLYLLNEIQKSFTELPKLLMHGDIEKAQAQITKVEEKFEQNRQNPKFWETENCVKRAWKQIKWFFICCKHFLRREGKPSYLVSVANFGSRLPSEFAKQALPLQRFFTAAASKKELKEATTEDTQPDQGYSQATVV
ncbi:MAG: hypothetical protein GKR77_00800 [Legionellales bacterium]|nr:hypothetical protein [Legionellales bacterium]